MYKRDTEDLTKALEGTHPNDIQNYIDENEGELLDGDRDFMRYMNAKFKEKGIQKQTVLLKADISQGYGYKLLTEEKVTKQRDVILRICYAAGFDLNETQRALELYHMGRLYPRDPRDALLMTFFNDRPGSILDLNAMLHKNKMAPLKSSGVQE